MNAFHDRDAGMHVAASAATLRGRSSHRYEHRRGGHEGEVDGVDGVDGAALDVLSDVLRRVRLTGAMFFLVEASAPWKSRAPRAQVFGSAVLPGSRNIVSYHMVVAGSCWAGLEGEAPLRLDPGDVLVVPHGDAYFLADPPDTPARYGDADALQFFRAMAAGRLAPIVTENGEGATTTRFLCGFLGCDAHPFNPLLASLPAIVRVPRGALGERLQQLVDFALSELRDPRPGSRDVVLRLSELMFVEVLRGHAAAGERTIGWFSALDDPLVSRALARLHGEPARAWTLGLLADEVGTSRSVLAERFSRAVGHPPIAYLHAWRMQLAAGMLSERSARVKWVAASLGYESESAFSRAFKKATGVAPRGWRDDVP